MIDKLNIITLSGHELELVEQYAEANFAPRQIAKLLRKPYAMLKLAITNPNTLVYEAYQRGLLNIKATKHFKLVEKVKSGSITAIQESNKASELLEFDNIKAKIFDL